MTRSTLVLGARLVPVGAPVALDGLVDIRITDGVVTEVAPGLPRGPDEPVVEADGRWAIPGLWDQHVHLTMWSDVHSRLDVSGTESAEAVTRLVADHLATGSAGSQGTVVLGFGYRSATWATPPTVARLDAVSGGRPVILTSGDGHNGWLSTPALQLLGVPPRTGPIDERDWFDLQPAIAALTDSTPDSTASTDRGIRAALADAATRGVVGMVDFEFTSAYLAWPERVARGMDTARIRAAAYPDRLDDVIAAGLRTGDPLDSADGLFTMGPLKIISDGSLNTRTASCCEPYADAASLESPYGRQNYSPAQLSDLLTRARDHGLEIALHAIGDAAVGLALDAFETTHAHGGIEHAQLMRLEDIPRMRSLRVRASVQPAHLIDDRDVTEHCWPDRADRCFPLQSLLRGGVTLVLGSDAPVAPLDPWLAMAAAVHRSGDEREPWNPAESLTSAQALAASTDGQTTIAAGSRGDIVLLEQDPLRSLADTAAAAALRGMPVAATLVAGRLVHPAAG